MPELPEVNTVAELLNRTVVDDEIKSVQLHCQKLRKPLPTHHEFKTILNRKINAVTRTGKIILFNFGENKYLWAHLGMTGAFVLRSTTNIAQSDQKHEHVKMSLKSGRSLSFVDQRRFGYLVIKQKPDISAPEPLKDQLSKEYLGAICQNKASPIKLLILNQKLIVGLGNIYANEALFKAGIHPSKPASKLNKSEITSLHQSILGVIKLAINSGLKSIDKRPILDTETIHFPINPLVYGKSSQPCQKCNGTIEKIKLSGRSTFFCPNCQRL